MKLLFISNLFPDAVHPVRGLDNATLLHCLQKDFGFEVRVISPRPAFPHLVMRPVVSEAKPREMDGLFETVYPQVAYVPRFGSRWNDRLMVNGIRDVFLESISKFQPDVVMASWLFPDGCAVAQLCREVCLPLVLITQGTDTHQYLEYPIRRRKIVEAIGRSEAVICRSGDLAVRLHSAGVPQKKLEVIYNGIDPDQFCPRDKTEMRNELGITEESPLLLFVGNFLPVKDPLFLLRAHAGLNVRRREEGKAPATLCMIGGGPLRGKMEREIARLGTTDLVAMPGRMNSDQIAKWMNAADVFCLSSLNEGFPNVLLEAMACDLPIVSTDVGGIKEKVGGSHTGRLVPCGEPAIYVDEIESTLAGVERDDSISEADQDLSWAASAAEYDRVLRKAAVIDCHE